MKAGLLIVLVLLAMALVGCVPPSGYGTGSRVGLPTRTNTLDMGSCYCRSQYYGEPNRPCELISLGNGQTAIGCSIGIPSN